VGGGNGLGAPSKTRLLSSIRGAIPLGVRQSVTRCLPRSVQHKLSLKWTSAGIDWQRTQVSCIPNANEGYLRVNLRGREPLGIVEHGASCTELLSGLEAEMRKLRNPANGCAAAHQVFLIDEVFPGTERRHLPDLVVAWDPDARLLAEMDAPSAGTVTGPAGYQTSPFYTGNHRPNAFVLARGPGIPANERLEQGHIVDLAPTVLAILGVDPPPHFEGSAWPRFAFA
jgi:predicted AlkP superfamily phosphohydrolase/phosphomutase